MNLISCQETSKKDYVLKRGLGLDAFVVIFESAAIFFSLACNWCFYKHRYVVVKEFVVTNYHLRRKVSVPVTYAAVQITCCTAIRMRNDELFLI